MDIAYKRAFTDVLYIVNSLDNRLQNKISRNFIDFMKKNCDKSYTPSNILLSNPYTLSQETKNVLSLIYRSYLNNKKREFSNIDDEISKKNIFTKEHIEKKDAIPENKSMIVQTKDNGIFRKIYNFIQHIFKHGGNK